MTQGIDHLVYAVPSLERGMAEMEALLGVPPVVGGRHPTFGTHNALLSLGETTYLEIIAPDPEVPRPERGLVFGVEGIRRPRLATWALRCERIEEGARRAEAAGARLGRVQEGSREGADGVRLSWRLTDPYSMPFDGVGPFLIAWGETPHPAAAAPHAGDLVQLRLEHPDAGALLPVLESLAAGSEVVLVEAAAPRLACLIRTPSGIVELSGESP